jgi:hypothetical protein
MLASMIDANNPAHVIMGIWILFAGVGYMLTTGKH